MRSVWINFAGITAWRNRLEVFLQKVFQQRSEDFLKCVPNNYFKYSFPELSEFKIVTLLTADKTDGMAHRTTLEIHPAKDKEQTIVDTNDENTFKHLWVFNFNSYLPNDLLKIKSADSTQRTTFLSGSDVNPKRQGTEKTILKIEKDDFSRQLPLVSLRRN